MKIKNSILVVLALLTVLSFGCKKEDKKVATQTGTGKAMMSDWAVNPAGSWHVRFDVHGNLSGTNFQIIFKSGVDNSEVHCTARMTGDQSLGTYTVDNDCAGPGTGSHMDGIVGAFQTGGNGSYTNDGTTLNLCKHGGTCHDYH